MKIDMTEKSALEGFFKNWMGERAEGVQFFRSTMALLGVEFEPEEPELPERISVTDLLNLATRGFRVRTEAARRFNSWGKLRKWLESEAAGRTGNYSYVMGVAFNKLDSLLSEED